MKLLLKEKKRFESPPKELLSIYRMMEREEEKRQRQSKILVARILVEMHRMKACDQEPTGAKVHDEPDYQAKYEALLARVKEIEMRNKEVEMRNKEVEMKLKGMEEEEKKKKK